MVSTADPYEANWGQKQQQLNTERNARATSIPRPYDADADHLNNSKKTLDKLIKNAEESVRKIPAKKPTNSILKKPATNTTTTRRPAPKLSKPTPTPKPSFTPRQQPTTSTNNLASLSRTQLSHAETGTVKRGYTPLNPPVHLRNNSTGGYNYDHLINPLPNIRSPYLSARDTNYYPDLNEWGVTQTVNYDDNRYTTFARGNGGISPFLPTYNLAKKAQKGYVIMPKTRNFEQYTTDSDNPSSNPNRLDYISTIPYTNPIVSTQIENFDMRTNENIENVQKVLKTMDAKNYDGKELFSTKFLEDLDYQANLNPSRSPYRTPQVQQSLRASYPQPRQQQVQRSTEADAHIQNIRNEVERQSRSINSKQGPIDESLFNAITLDVTEKIYYEEIDRFVERLVNESIGENLEETAAREEPVLRVYDKVYDIVSSDMLADIAAEVLGEEMKRISAVNNNEIKKVAKEELVSNLMLDHMLDKIVQHGRASGENGDINKILDGMIIDVLLNTNKSVNKIKDKTLKNYPIKKFHLNSFMNVALDILVAELSTNLEEDMKELELLEQDE